MKMTFRETETQVSIHLTPETLEEVSMLFRFANNTKRTPPYIHMSFSQYNTNNVPYCNVIMEKLSIAKQVTSISK